MLGGPRRSLTRSLLKMLGRVRNGGFCDSSAQAAEEGGGGREGSPETTIGSGQWPAWSGQHPAAVLAGKAKHQQPAQVDCGDPQRPPQVVALDPAVGHPPTAVGDQQ